jgi:hypothetical protein
MMTCDNCGAPLGNDNRCKFCGVVDAPAFIFDQVSEPELEEVDERDDFDREVDMIMSSANTSGVRLPNDGMTLTSDLPAASIVKLFLFGMAVVGVGCWWVLS